jgi:hypothetical protein
LASRIVGLRNNVRLMREGELEGGEHNAKVSESDADRAFSELRKVRAMMRVLGLVPPTVPASLATVDEMRAK